MLFLVNDGPSDFLWNKFPILDIKLIAIAVDFASVANWVHCHLKVVKRTLFNFLKTYHKNLLPSWFCTTVEQLIRQPSNNFVHFSMASIHNHTNCLADVVFLIDSSGSISQTDFNTTKYFVNSVVADLPVSTNQTNVGVIQYSGNMYYGLTATTLANYYHFYPFSFNLNYTILPYMNFRHYANGFERFFLSSCEFFSLISWQVFQ